MSYRKRLKEQRRLERERSQEKTAHQQSLRNLAIGGVVVLALAAVAAGGFLLLSGGSAEEAQASVAVTMGDNFFQPAAVNLKTGQKTKVSLYNGGAVTHNLWTSGPDRESGTGDDVRSADVEAGQLKTVEVQFDEAGEYGFSCEFHAGQIGRFVVAP
jgi:plastocyanin